MLGTVATDALDKLMPTAMGAPSATIADGGAHLQLKAPATGARRLGGGLRGEIREFTRAARKRVMVFFNQLDQRIVEHTPLFITLTYHETWPATGKECKPQLQAFVKRLVRSYPRAAVIWRLEYQKRGAPHFHLLVFGVPFIARQDVSTWWWEICGRDTDAHLRAGTNIERVRSWRGVLSYASKYIAKLGGEILDQSPGRFWGVINGRALARHLTCTTMTWRAWYALRRYIWRYQTRAAIASGRRSALVGASLFIPASDAIRLLGLALQPP